MADVSIADAKSRFAELVHQAEGGQAVRITRRGRPVAVLVSESEYARLHGGKVGLLAYTQAWRTEAAAAGAALADDGAFDNLRDQTERPAPDLR